MYLNIVDTPAHAENASAIIHITDESVFKITE